MKNYLVIVCVAFVLAIFIENVSPCAYPRDWKILPLKDRITQANTVVLGYVENLYPSKETAEIFHSNNTVTHLPRYYTAKVVLQCAFHGKYSKTVQSVFNVSVVNTGLSCGYTKVMKHQSYILMLNGSLSSTELQPMEINHQSAATQVTEPSVDVIRTEFGFDITEHDGKYTCQRASVTGPEKNLKRMDPAMVIGNGKTKDNNSANIITNAGLILTLTGAFLISGLF
ncbi:uncharacterized protein LOC117124157 [Anneissia japonica]|uniref:uncharacterized protein LOC117124157 n=1 Tax=Anneissia japonica TaxID=1529436 RepID=UPI0014256A4B|nr:uncharacterized protein LOC117124157 [Anneissia japonica]